MASPGPNARTGQSRDHGGQALLGSQASARQSLTARRSRAVDRSRERHGWSIGVRVRPHRAPCGASLPVGRSVFESGRPETGVYPLTIGFVLVGTNDLNRAICFYNARSAPRSEPSVSLSFGHRADGHWCPENSSWRVSLSFYEGRDCYTRFYEGERRPRIGYPGFVCSNLGEPR